MNREFVRTIHPTEHIDTEIEVPPSKSYTNRALIVAALADGTSILNNPSRSEDSGHLLSALQAFGIDVETINDGIRIQGSRGCFDAPSKELFVGNAGTAMRFLSTFASLARGETTITGDEQMLQRPIGDLLDALRMSGIRCKSRDGFPPVTIHGGTFGGGRIDVHAEKSSQFLSSLLLSAPYANKTTTIHVKGKLSSLPYINVSLHVMRSFGAEVDVSDFSLFRISNTDNYIGREFTIEPDASAATYFLAGAAITGGRVVINNLSTESLQGDVKFIDVLSEMGCNAIKHEGRLELRGGRLRGIDVDMNQLPDCVPTLAVVAAFADGPTTISNVAHLQFKESNRLQALATELTRMGTKVEVLDDGMIIHPGRLHGATIETYNDHRIAMSFAIAGLRIKGLAITNPGCVAKSFPNFWEEFEKFESKEN